MNLPEERLLSPPTVGGIVLCGGKSSRMGTAKALLPFGTELLIQRVVRILQGVVAPVVVVAAREQELPPLPGDVVVVRDEFEALGPLAGIATGLAALAGKADAAYVTATDVPLLRPEFVAAIVDRIRGNPAADLVIPQQGKFYQPLSAAYRCSLEPVIRQMVTDGKLRPAGLVDAAHSVVIPVDDLRSVDPDLESLLNCNTPEEYAAVLDRAGQSRRLDLSTS